MTWTNVEVVPYLTNRSLLFPDDKFELHGLGVSPRLHTHTHAYTYVSVFICVIEERKQYTCLGCVILTSAQMLH